MLNRRGHPDQRDLLRYYDGELSPRRAETVRSHVEACSDCRSHLTETERNLNAYLWFRREVLDATPAPPLPWMDPYKEFERVGTRQGMFAAPGRHTRWLLGGAAAVCAAAFIHTLRPVPPAREVHPTATPKVSVRSEPAPPTTTVPRAHVAPVRPVTADDELRVIGALHEIGADLGEPVKVLRRPDQIVVSAIGLDPPHAARLRSALREMPEVIVYLSAGPVAARRAGAAREVVGSPAPPAIARQFATPEDYEAFVDGVLSQTDAMMARAHALHDLEARFPPEVVSSMKPESQRFLARIRQQHMSALANDAAMIETSVRPLLPQVSAAEPASAGSLFSDCANVDRLLAAVFAGVDNAQPVSAEENLARALDHLKTDLKRMDMN
ncbi:MAG TPA: zf-HC2 domain-containing protein [Bryobacteraceae bacterium]|nr:zf-HC2 domain-containing protein [Bryobacteraceae bacterium]